MKTKKHKTRLEMVEKSILELENDFKELKNREKNIIKEIEMLSTEPTPLSRWKKTIYGKSGPRK